MKMKSFFFHLFSLLASLLLATSSYAAPTNEQTSHLTSTGEVSTNTITLSSLKKPKGKLIFAIDIIRHGDRTPEKELPADPHHWKEGLGQLTPIGMHQEFELGKKFREHYVSKAHLLAPTYSAEHVYVRASDYDRTLMSAESLLMGLYPLGTGPEFLKDGYQEPAVEGRYQPIPIHTVPKDDERLLIPDSKRHHFVQIAKNRVLKAKAWKEKETELKPYFPAWSKATGVSITHLEQLVSIGDTLRVRKLYNIPLPQGLTPQDADKIIKAGQWVMIDSLKNEAIAKDSGGELLKEIATYLQQASTQKTPLKYLLYSGHDSTIMIATSALNAPLDEVPHYASHLNISLFDQGNNDYRVVFTYNDKPLILPCTGTNSCSLRRFYQLARFK